MFLLNSNPEFPVLKKAALTGSFFYLFPMGTNGNNSSRPLLNPAPFLFLTFAAFTDRFTFKKQTQNRE